jgi:mannose-1-phosphate guanylyltransferase
MITRVPAALLDVGKAARCGGLAALALDYAAVGDADRVRATCHRERSSDHESNAVPRHWSSPITSRRPARVFERACSRTRLVALWSGIPHDSAHRSSRSVARAMILCAGLGERMRPLTDELPKPLLPVGDGTALGEITSQLATGGYESAVANTHWMPDKFSEVSNAYEVTLNLVHEPVIRGQAGGVAGARAQLEAPVVVWNGDILIEAPPLERLVQIVGATSGVCLAVAPSRGLGTVGLDIQDRVVRVRGERHGDEVRSADYVGLFALGARALTELPDQGCLVNDYWLPRLRRGEHIDTCPITGAWGDVGSFAAYAATNARWLAAHANRASGSFVHASAQVGARVELERCVIGAGAIVEGEGVLSGCIVWPGSRVAAPSGPCIVTPRTRVELGAPPAA